MTATPTLFIGCNHYDGEKFYNIVHNWDALAPFDSLTVYSRDTDGVVTKHLMLTHPENGGLFLFNSSVNLMQGGHQGTSLVLGVYYEDIDTVTALRATDKGELVFEDNLDNLIRTAYKHGSSPLFQRKP